MSHKIIISLIPLSQFWSKANSPATPPIEEVLQVEAGVIISYHNSLFIVLYSEFYVVSNVRLYFGLW